MYNELDPFKKAGEIADAEEAAKDIARFVRIQHKAFLEQGFSSFEAFKLTQIAYQQLYEMERRTR